MPSDLPSSLGAQTGNKGSDDRSQNASGNPDAASPDVEDIDWLILSDVSSRFGDKISGKSTYLQIPKSSENKSNGNSNSISQGNSKSNGTSDLQEDIDWLILSSEPEAPTSPNLSNGHLDNSLETPSVIPVDRSSDLLEIEQELDNSDWLDRHGLISEFQPESIEELSLNEDLDILDNSDWSVLPDLDEDISGSLLPDDRNPDLSLDLSDNLDPENLIPDDLSVEPDFPLESVGLSPTLEADESESWSDNLDPLDFDALDELGDEIEESADLDEAYDLDTDWSDTSNNFDVSDNLSGDFDSPANLSEPDRDLVDRVDRSSGFDREELSADAFDQYAESSNEFSHDLEEDFEDDVSSDWSNSSPTDHDALSEIPDAFFDRSEDRSTEVEAPDLHSVDWSNRSEPDIEIDPEIDVEIDAFAVAGLSSESESGSHTVDWSDPEEEQERFDNPSDGFGDNFGVDRTIEQESISAQSNEVDWSESTESDAEFISESIYTEEDAFSNISSVETSEPENINIGVEDFAPAYPDSDYTNPIESIDHAFDIPDLGDAEIFEEDDLTSYLPEQLVEESSDYLDNSAEALDAELADQLAQEIENVEEMFDDVSGDISIGFTDEDILEQPEPAPEYLPDREYSIEHSANFDQAVESIESEFDDFDFTEIDEEFAAEDLAEIDSNLNPPTNIDRAVEPIESEFDDFDFTEIDEEFDAEFNPAQPLPETNGSSWQPTEEVVDPPLSQTSDLDRDSSEQPPSSIDDGGMTDREMFDAAISDLDNSDWSAPDDMNEASYTSFDEGDYDENYGTEPLANTSEISIEQPIDLDHGIYSEVDQVDHTDSDKIDLVHQETDRAAHDSYVDEYSDYYSGEESIAETPISETSDDSFGENWADSISDEFVHDFDEEFTDEELGLSETLDSEIKKWSEAANQVDTAFEEDFINNALNKALNIRESEVDDTNWSPSPDFDLDFDLDMTEQIGQIADPNPSEWRDKPELKDEAYSAIDHALDHQDQAVDSVAQNISSFKPLPLPPLPRSNPNRSQPANLVPNAANSANPPQVIEARGASQNRSGSGANGASLPLPLPLSRKPENSPPRTRENQGTDRNPKPTQAKSPDWFESFHNHEQDGSSPEPSTESFGIDDLEWSKLLETDNDTSGGIFEIQDRGITTDHASNGGNNFNNSYMEQATQALPRGVDSSGRFKPQPFNNSANNSPSLPYFQPVAETANTQAVPPAHTEPVKAKAVKPARSRQGKEINLETIWQKYLKLPAILISIPAALFGVFSIPPVQKFALELGLKIQLVKDVSGKNLEGANFQDAVLKQVNFSNANLSGANFTKANLNLADFSGADLTNANLIGASLQGSYLRGSKIGSKEAKNEAKLDSQDRLMWQIVNLPQAGRNLAGQNLSWFNLNSANLRNANLTKSKLIGVDFHKADLKGANFAGSDLTAVNFVGTNLKGANLSGISFTKTKSPKSDNTTICPNGKKGPCSF